MNKIILLATGQSYASDDMVYTPTSKSFLIKQCWYKYNEMISHVSLANIQQ